MFSAEVSKTSYATKHPYHLVSVSPWPFFASCCAFALALNGIRYMHFYENGFFYFLWSVFALLFVVILWWRDVIREATFEGHHTSAVQRGLKIGMILFIVSEIMFFFAFFWAFFHSSLVPAIEIGGIWPPLGITVFNPWRIPFLNTLILLLSGVTVTWAHHAIVGGFREEAIRGLLLTIGLGVWFTFLQAFEYKHASFTIADGIYGSIFYMATGFHGFHVLIGTLFLSVCFYRLVNYHFTTEHHFGFEAAAWYWHFVDVVWLFLFVSIYWWGS